MFGNFLKKNKFKEPKNQAVFTCIHIINENKPILYVKQDDEGDWQFLCGENHTTEDARIIALQEIVNIDPSVSNVLNLKYGQALARDNIESEWKLL